MAPLLQDDIETEQSGSTFVIKLARPAKKNALTIAMYQRLNAALEEAARTQSVRSVVFASTSDVYTAGNDLNDFMQNPPTGDDSPVYRFIQTLGGFEKPLIGAVDGKAIGLGFTMLLHFDFVYLSERAVLTAPFVDLGLVPEAASSLLLPRMIGHARAAEVLLLGKPVDAKTALALGLCTAVVAPERVLPQALETAALIAGKAPNAVKGVKALMQDRAAVLAHMKLEAQLFSKQLASPEVAEAISAFFEKRKPDFSQF